jgi:hypothetical protein
MASDITMGRVYHVEHGGTQQCSRYADEPFPSVDTEMLPPHQSGMVYQYFFYTYTVTLIQNVEYVLWF